ncbi:MAG: hypothetical protein ACC642_11485, partial [Pseudomonadales bacterium]
HAMKSMNEHMSKQRWLVGTGFLSMVLAFGLYGVVINALEGEGAPLLQDDVYIEECGACHYAYLPGLLPASSWRGIMQGLEDHFGENAELDGETSAHIASYLEQGALQAGKPSKFSRLLRNMPADPPLRITELPAFINMHYEIPIQLQVKTLKEGFLSPCADCHREAAEGIFDPDRLHPGYGPSVWGKQN